MSEYALLDSVCASKAFESSDAAERTIHATLAALGASLSAGNRRALADQLPEHYASSVRDVEAPEPSPLELEAFIERVQEEADVRNPKPKVRVVVASLVEFVDEAVVEDARAQLPPEYGTLFEPASVEPGETFVDVVVEEGGFDEAEAEAATRETLAALGRRLTEGEAEDIAAYLRGDASSWLTRHATHDAEELSPTEFVETIAERADVSEERARAYAAAVGEALTDLVPEAERNRAAAQLPDEYASVVPLSA